MNIEPNSHMDLRHACDVPGQDMDGEPLNRQLGEPMDPGLFLPLASRIAAAVSRLHRQGVVHKDLRPTHILVNDVSGAVYLKGSGVAGSLEYIAPEQTGRVNRPVDSRTDLYCLGVMFYEMLTGSLPFSAGDAMEWVHCHIARTPVPPAERLESIPVPVSALVMKLLAKTPEDRYQTAAGLEADLRRCLIEWDACGHIDDFPLAQHDTTYQVRVPKKLYGRAHAVETLLGTYNRVVSSGRSEALLISGYSGIGKSALVQEMHKALPTPGWFAAGKFDRYKRDVPYATLAQAFRALVQYLLGKSDGALAIWRQALLEGLGPNGRLITDLIPELALIVGEQAPVPELPPEQAQRRFQLAFRRFICVFARPEHPLVLFLDDLQWLDPATLELLEDLFAQSDVQHLFVIGAYRNNELEVTHGLGRRLPAIKNAGWRIEEIPLAPLDCEHICQLLADALRCPPDDAMPLARLVHEKTEGNPFFSIQFITALAEEGLLFFDHDRASWSWDLARIRDKGYTDNVVDLMAAKLRRLLPACQNALKELSCLGTTIPLLTWKIVHRGAHDTGENALDEAVRAGLVLASEVEYRFLHDRVRDAAYSLITPDERAGIHLRIGRLLMAGYTEDELVESVFDVVNQFNNALPLITETRERDTVRTLNVMAGRRSRAAAAYASARHYLLEAIRLLPAESWQDSYDETFTLHLDLAESECLSGNFAAADVLFGLMFEHARSAVDRARVYQLQMQVYQVSGQLHNALAAVLQGLALFGVTFPDSDEQIAAATAEEFARIRRNLAGRSLTDLLEAEDSGSADVRIVSALLAGAMSPVYVARPDLWPLLVAKSVNLFLRVGNTEESCIAYSSYGSILVSLLGQIPEGFAMSQMAIQLNERIRGVKLKGGLLLAFGACVNFWSRPFGSSVRILEQAAEACLQVGDLPHAGYSTLSITWLMFERGDLLDSVAGAVSQYAERAERGHNKAMQLTLRLQHDMLDELRGARTSASEDESGRWDQAQAVEFLDTANFRVGITIHKISRLVAAFLLGRHTDALACATEAQAMRSAVPGMVHELTCSFFHALTLAALFPETSEPLREQFKGLIDEYLQKLKVWAQNCPENFESRARLLSAELARIEGRVSDAEMLYEQAIRSAHLHGHVHIEALSHELAGRFYLQRSLDTSANAHLRYSVACYSRWGAEAKVRQIERQYPSIAADDPLSAAAALVRSPVRQLDVETVIKASQALSGEMLLPKLIQSLMTIALENAGASRGLLVMPQGDTYRIEAEAAALGETVEVTLCDRPITDPDCPEAILRYVMRTRRRVILDDATQPYAVRDEQYQRSRQPRSILCLPLIREGGLPGLLYLENTLTSHAFTPDRVALLELLAGQAAISLENTRLYADLQARERRFRQLVDSNVIGITFWDVNTRVHAANDAFLSLVGYSREDLTAGKINFRVMTPSEYHDADTRALQQLRQTGTFTPFEKECIAKDGRRIPILVGGAFQEGSQQEGVAFVLDLSERRRAEVERQARQTAEAASMAKSDFLAVMSHDLRTPLNSILGYAQILLRDASLNERYRSAMEVIQHSGGQLLALINDVLDLAKIEARKFELHVTEFSLFGFLCELADLVSVNARQKELRFATDWASDLPARIRGDKQCLRRVLLNLLSNAIKFTDSGTVTFRVRFAPPEGLQFEVCDTGIGIREDQLERIFEPFGQVADPARRTAGTGLGLTISRRLVASMGGRLHASSRVGHGSSFGFELQVSVVDRAEESEQTVSVPPDVSGYAGVRRRILIADDIASSRAVLSDWLAPLGFEIVEAVDGVDTVAKAIATRPDLILMDLSMPQMDGLEAIRLLRSSEGLGGLPIIAISASASEREVASSSAAGANAFVAKPIDFERLQEKVGELLGITWSYDRLPEAGEGAVLPEADVCPPDAEIEILYELAQQGCMSDIHRRAEQLVSLGECYAPFARKLQRLAKGYQSQAILKLIEHHRGAIG